MMRALVKWMFWRTVYLFRRCPKALRSYIVRGQRCRSPWWKFRPSVFHNHDGKMWHIYLTDEESYTRSPDHLLVKLHIGGTSGNIVGFDVFDESLAKKGGG